MEVFNSKDFADYRENYSLMLELLFSNSLISDFFNNVASPSQIDGYSNLMLDALRPYEPCLMQNLISQLESEFIFVREQNEPFIFLRERSRLAARLTGDFIAERMKPLLRPFLQRPIECVDDDMSVQEVSELFIQIFFSEEFVRAMPLDVCFLLKNVVKLSKVYGFGQYSYMLSGNLLFLRCFCPAMSAPDFYQISDKQLNAKVRTVLIKASKILNYIPNSIQDGFYLDEGLEDDAEFIFGHEQEYMDFVDQILAKDYRSIERGIIYHTKCLMRKKKSDSGNCSTSISSSENSTPQEFIINYLKAQRDEKISIDSSKYSLRTLGGIHSALVSEKEKIYDIVQEIYKYTGEYHSEFSIDIHRQRFERLLKTYADYYYLADTKLYGTLALLQQLLEKCPPISPPVERKRPALWRSVNVKNQYIKISYNNVYLFRGDCAFADYECSTSGGSELMKIIESSEIREIKLFDTDFSIHLQLLDAQQPLILIFEDLKTMQELATELVETCYMRCSGKSDYYELQTHIIVFKDSLSVLVKEGLKISYHLSQIKSVTQIMNSVKLILKSDEIVFYELKDIGESQELFDSLSQHIDQMGKTMIYSDL